MQNEVGEKANYARRRIVARLVIRLLALFVALSFPVALLPLVRVSAASSTMACCIGKKEEESHCHASAKAKKAAAHNHSTDASKPAFQSAVHNPCHSDCCACSTSTRQQREKVRTQTVARPVAPTLVAARFEVRSVVVSSKHEWAQTSPRGPPAFLL